MSVRRRDAHIHPRADVDATTEFASDVRYYLGLAPRQLPSRYLYDALGSALFDAICELPWYTIPRAEAHLLSEHRHDVFGALGRVTTIVELGPGRGEKLRTLVEARPSPPDTLAIHLIDVSRTALIASERALGELEDIAIVTHEAPYEAGLEELGRGSRAHGVTLALFLGSNIGNFDRPGADAFLRTIRAALVPGDALLLGADLVKPEHDLLLAYDDPLGITAAFNRNLLVRINRELGGHFDIGTFGHRALWNGRESRMEMHLVARTAHRVRIDAPDLEIDFANGEAIWTESSYKYRPDEVVQVGERAGFTCLAQWVEKSALFALSLFQAG
jgi:dimethylhistidine N-methyltransferase